MGMLEGVNCIEKKGISPSRHRSTRLSSVIEPLRGQETNSDSIAARSADVMGYVHPVRSQKPSYRSIFLVQWQRVSVGSGCVSNTNDLKSVVGLFAN